MLFNLFMFFVVCANVIPGYLRPLIHVIIKYKAVPDGSVSNIRSLIHLVILQSLGDTTFFKRAIQTDTQTHRAYKSLQVPSFNVTVNVGNDKYTIKSRI